MTKYYDCIDKEIKYITYKELKKLSWSKNLSISKIKRCNSKSRIGEWDYKALSNHPNLNNTWLEELKEGDWNFDDMSYSSNIDETWLRLFPSAPWRFDVLSRQPDINIDWLKAIPDGKWNFNVLSCNRRLNINWINLFPDKDWNIIRLVEHPHFKLEWINNLACLADFEFDTIHLPLELHHLKYILKYPKLQWNFQKVSRHYELDLDWILAFPEADWDYETLSRSIKLDLTWLRALPHKKLYFTYISKSPRLDLDWLLEYQDVDWDFNVISENPKLDVQWLYRFPNKNWNITSLTLHPNLTYRWFEALPHRKWPYTVLVKPESKFELSWIEKLPNIEWSFYHLSEHPDIDLDFFRKYNMESWNMRMIARSDKMSYEWLKEFKNRNWDFLMLSTNKNFKFSWLEIFPEANWNFTYISQIYPNNYYYKGNRKWSFINSLTLPVLEKYQQKPWILEFLINNKHVDINWLIATPYIHWTHPKIYKSLITRKSLKGTALHRSFPQVEHMISLIQNAFNLKKYKTVQFLYEIAKYKIVPETMDSIYPLNGYFPLQLTNLSGDTYEIYNWLHCKNLLRKIRTDLKDLEYFNIYLTADKEEDSRLFTHGKSSLIKKMLLEMKEGPNAMIVYE